MTRRTRIGVGLIGANPRNGWAALAHVPALRALPDRYAITARSTTSGTFLIDGA